MLKVEKVDFFGKQLNCFCISYVTLATGEDVYAKVVAIPFPSDSCWNHTKETATELFTILVKNIPNVGAIRVPLEIGDNKDGGFYGYFRYYPGNPKDFEDITRYQK